MLDIILRDCGKVGWLPIIERDGRETFRGEFQISPQYALWKAFEVEDDSQEEA